MGHKDTGWRPEGASGGYYGFEVWDHNGTAPHKVNDGEVDPEWKVEDSSDVEGEDEE